IVSGLKLNRSLGHHPLFQVVFALEQPLLKDLDLAGLDCSAVSIGPRPMPYDMIVMATEDPDGLDLVIDYNVDLFDAVSVDRLGRHYLNLLEEIAAVPDRPLFELAITINRTGEQKPVTTSAEEPQPGAQGGRNETASDKRELLRRLL